MLDKKESLKLDVYVREMISGELDRSELQEVFDGVFFPVACHVDTAIAKLIWISKGSHKSRSDLRAMFRKASYQQRQAIRASAAERKLDSLLDEVLSESDHIE